MRIYPIDCIIRLLQKYTVLNILAVFVTDHKFGDSLEDSGCRFSDENFLWFQACGFTFLRTKD
jgi:hypothetical protein